MSSRLDSSSSRSLSRSRHSFFCFDSSIFCSQSLSLRLSGQGVPPVNGQKGTRFFMNSREKCKC